MFTIVLVIYLSDLLLCHFENIGYLRWIFFLVSIFYIRSLLISSAVVTSILSRRLIFLQQSNEQNLYKIANDGAKSR